MPFLLSLLFSLGGKEGIMDPHPQIPNSSQGAYARGPEGDPDHQILELEIGVENAKMPKEPGTLLIGISERAWN